MHSHELTTGRTFGARFDPGESFFPELEDFCRKEDIRHGYVPMFLAAFAEADVVGSCDKLDDPEAPVWSKVHLTNAEALGCGTIAYDEEAERIVRTFTPPWASRSTQPPATPATSSPPACSFWSG
jgi:predicted DNA-binding protein with PD1-like motif